MKPEASTLSTAILLISAGESVAEISKLVEKELKEIGLGLRFGVVSSAKLECSLQGSDLNIEVSDKAADVESARDLAVSTLANIGVEVSDGFLHALKQCDTVIRLLSDDDSQFTFEGEQAVVYVRPKLTTEFEPFRQIVDRISDTFRGFVYDPSIGSAYTTKAGFGPRNIKPCAAANGL